MLHFTLLIFTKEGKEAAFAAYEEKVLPLLARYNGQLLYRMQPGADDAVNGEMPYEIHILGFNSRADYQNYMQSPQRRALEYMRQEAIEKIITVEGDE